MESKGLGFGIQTHLDGDEGVCADCFSPLENGRCPACDQVGSKEPSVSPEPYDEVIPSKRNFRKTPRRSQLERFGKRKSATSGEEATFLLKLPVRVFGDKPIINFEDAVLSQLQTLPAGRRPSMRRRYSVSTSVLRRGTDRSSRISPTRIAYPSFDSGALPRDRSESARRAWETRRLSSKGYLDSTINGAAGWYQRFIVLLDPERKGYFKGFNGPDTDPAWTDYVIDVIARWGRGSGYEVVLDRGSRVRFDITWARQGISQVVIEHENDGESKQSPIEREIEKLVHNTQAPLRVLITYFKNGAFPEGVSRLRNSVENELTKVSKYDFELLAMAAPYDVADPQEYVACLFRPSFVPQLVLPRY